MLEVPTCASATRDSLLIQIRKHAQVSYMHMHTHTQCYCDEHCGHRPFLNMDCPMLSHGDLPLFLLCWPFYIPKIMAYLLSISPVKVFGDSIFFSRQTCKQRNQRPTCCLRQGLKNILIEALWFVGSSSDSTWGPENRWAKRNWMWFLEDGVGIGGRLLAENGSRFL